MFTAGLPENVLKGHLARTRLKNIHRLTTLPFGRERKKRGRREQCGPAPRQGGRLRKRGLGNTDPCYEEQRLPNSIWKPPWGMRVSARYQSCGNPGKVWDLCTFPELWSKDKELGRHEGRYGNTSRGEAKNDFVVVGGLGKKLKGEAVRKKLSRSWSPGF